jgi:hypothetical protein
MGRKSYLFFGADSGSECAASFYTLIRTAKLDTLDRRFISARSWRASLITQSTGSATSCRGTSLTHSNQSQQKPLKIQIGVHLKSGGRRLRTHPPRQQGSFAFQLPTNLS